jgi:hypothetical protein
MELEWARRATRITRKNTDRVDRHLDKPIDIKIDAGETLTGHSSISLHSRIRGGMLKCRLPIGQPLRWNGQMEGIYTSVSSALIGERA